MTDVRLEPMTEDQYKPWRAEAEAHYARSAAASGQSAQDAARSALYEQLGFSETSRYLAKDL